MIAGKISTLGEPMVRFLARGFVHGFEEIELLVDKSFNGERRIFNEEAATNLSLGTEMLRGCNLLIDVEEGRAVLITRLPSGG